MSNLLCDISPRNTPVIARHMNYGLYRVEGKADCPKDALNICRMLSMHPAILERIEQAYKE